MSELLDAAVSPANIIVTSLFIFILIYWLVVIFGAIDMDFLDIDVDVDVDADIDVEAGVDVEAEGIDVSWFNSVLAFFNLGQIPLMIFLSFLILPAWGLSIIVNDYLGISSFLPGLVVLLIVLFISLFIAKFLTIPFIKVFGNLSKEGGEEKEKLIGKVCEVILPVSSTKPGQVKITTDGAPHVVNVKTMNNQSMSKGETALIIEYSENTNIYLIEPYNQ